MNPLMDATRPATEPRPLIPGVDFNPDMAIEHGHGWACRRCHVLVLASQCPKCGIDEAAAGF